METILRDIRYAVRSLLKRPVFSLIAVLTLALGIGSTTAIFSVVNGVLLRPLPYAEPDRLMMVFETNLSKGLPQTTVSPPNFVDWRGRNRVFEQTAAFTSSPFNLVGESEPERLIGAKVSGNLFSLLRVSPVLGSSFSGDDDRAGNQPVVMLSYGLWQRRFGGRQDVLGTTVRLSDQSYTIIGVMPAEFQFPARTELWTPIAFDGNDLQNRGTHFINVIARLKTGVTVRQAQTEMDALAAGLQREYPNSNSGWGARVMPLLDVAVKDIRPALLLLFAAVVVVLLIACTNVANLLLVRATARRREFAIRTSLGASRWRLTQQLLIEGLLLSLLGGALGTAMASWGVDLIVAINRTKIPRASQIGIDGRVWAFTIVISLLTGVVFGLLPALHSPRADLTRSLKHGGSNFISARSPLGRPLVIGQIALSLMLLIAAGLLFRSFERVREIDAGFLPQHLLTFQINLPKEKYREATQQRAFTDQVLARLASLPGVSVTGATTTLPFVGDNHNGFMIEGRPEVKASEAPAASYAAVTPDYFRAIGIPLISGRYFSSHDTPDGQRVVIINQALARNYFQNENPIGKRMRITDRTTTMREIVGVVGDVRQNGLESGVTPQMYEPYAQNPLSFSTFVLRTVSNPEALASAVRSQVYGVDHDQPLTNVVTMNQIMNDSISQRRLLMVLAETFAVIALTLSAIGLYGTLSYAVTRRTPELGLRMALGAQVHDVAKLVLKNGMIMALFGVMVGVVGALALTRFMTSLLFDITPTDLSTFVSAAAGVIMIALIACYLPARRATKVDPLVALRYE